MPHGHCYLWQAGTLWLNVASDGLIAAAYFAIPFSLYSFVRRRIAEIPFPGIFLMFAAFILLCGSTHVMEIWTVWNPAYRLSGALKLLTGIVSLATTIVLIRLMPLALQLRSPRELRMEVQARTAELAEANAALRRTAAKQGAYQRALLDSEQRFRAAIDAVQGVLWTNTAGGEMLGEQAAWAALTGQTFDQYQGFGWSAAVHPDDAEPTIAAWREAVDTRQPFVFEHRVRRHDGEWRLFSIRAIPIMDAHGAVREWVGVHIDITEQREGERHLRETEAALREANRRKDVFLATLSHELRNPLAPIRTAANLLAKDTLAPDAHERSRLIIVRQVRHMASLLDDLLDVSRITRGVFALKRAHVNLQSLLAEAVETARPSIDAKRHTLKLVWPSNPIEVQADPIRLVQIATNLLTNAAKYTDPEGLITFTVQIRDDQVLLSVRDTGIGLSPDMLTKVFEMFSQVAPQHGRTEGGLGIGLALVKGLVELHGGRIEARSEGLGHGSEFIVALPGVRAATGAPRQSLRAHSEASLPGSRRVLIADDNEDGAESLAMLIESSGHEVYVAHSGPDALQVAATQRPHIAILDIGMPGMDGYQVAREIRKETWGNHMTLIAVTGWGQEEDKQRALQAGFDHHLTKPVDPEQLEALLASSKTGR